MAVAHTTLLEYLGKEVTFKVTLPTDSDQSVFQQITGKVITVAFELNGKHSLCVLSEQAVAPFFYVYEDMIFS